MSRRPLATLDQIAEFTELPVRTIYDQVHRNVGVGALAYKVGRHLRWRWDEVDAWLDGQRISGSRAA